MPRPRLHHAGQLAQDHQGERRSCPAQHRLLHPGARLASPSSPSGPCTGTTGQERRATTPSACPHPHMTFYLPDGQTSDGQGDLDAGAEPQRHSRRGDDHLPASQEGAHRSPSPRPYPPTPARPTTWPTSAINGRAAIMVTEQDRREENHGRARHVLEQPGSGDRHHRGLFRLASSIQSRYRDARPSQGRAFSFPDPQGISANHLQTNFMAPDSIRWQRSHPHPHRRALNDTR